MKKKGFTLVELLAVIAILAILVVIVLPNVMYLFNKAKKESFETETKEVYKLAQQQWMSESMFTTEDKHYARTSSGECINSLDMTGRNEFEYYIKIDKSGNIIKLYTYDGTYQYVYSGTGLKIEDIQDAIQISKMDPIRRVKITCNSGKMESPVPVNNNYYLMAGNSNQGTSNFLRTTIKKNAIEKITFTDSIDGHSPNGTDCWDVSKGNNGSVLAWATDSDGNNRYELTIGANGDVFAYSGKNLFYYLTNLTSFEGMEHFDTSQVTNMSSMFEGCGKLTTIDLSNFNTSKVTDMSSMFAGYYELYYQAGGGDVGYVHVRGLLTNLDLGSFDTSNVTKMTRMFYNQSKLSDINLTSFDTSRVTSMSEMFTGCLNLVTLDLSSFDTSNVQYMGSMFTIPTGHSECGGICGFSFPDETFYTNTGGGLSDSHPNMKLKTIYASNKFVATSANGGSMFKYCTSLVGGTGTVYDPDNVGVTYAHVDGGASNPGYFTLKQ